MRWLVLMGVLVGCGEKEEEGFTCGEDTCVDGEYCREALDENYDVLSEACEALPSECADFDDLCFGDCIAEEEVCGDDVYAGCSEIFSSYFLQCQEGGTTY